MRLLWTGCCDVPGRVCRSEDSVAPSRARCYASKFPFKGRCGMSSGQSSWSRSVAHCGSSLAGSFIWSLIYTDIASTWTSGAAVWNRGSTGVLEQTRAVEEELPFPLLGLDFDNGGEWLNWHLIRYLRQRSRPIRVTSSRPYRD